MIDGKTKPTTLHPIQSKYDVTVASTHERDGEKKTHTHTKRHLIQSKYYGTIGSIHTRDVEPIIPPHSTHPERHDALPTSTLLKLASLLLVLVLVASPLHSDTGVSLLVFGRGVAAETDASETHNR